MLYMSSYFLLLYTVTFVLFIVFIGLVLSCASIFQLSETRMTFLQIKITCKELVVCLSDLHFRACAVGWIHHMNSGKSARWIKLGHWREKRSVGELLMMLNIREARCLIFLKSRSTSCVGPPAFRFYGLLSVAYPLPGIILKRIRFISLGCY